MTRKRFEKLCIGRMGIAPKDVRLSIMGMTELRRKCQDGLVIVYDEKRDIWRTLEIRSYAEIYRRLEQGEPVVE